MNDGQRVMVIGGVVIAANAITLGLIMRNVNAALEGGQPDAPGAVASALGQAEAAAPAAGHPPERPEAAGSDDHHPRPKATVHEGDEQAPASALPRPATDAGFTIEDVDFSLAIEDPILARRTLGKKLLLADASGASAQQVAEVLLLHAKLDQRSGEASGVLGPLPDPAPLLGGHEFVEVVCDPPLEEGEVPQRLDELVDREVSFKARTSAQKALETLARELGLLLNWTPAASPEWGRHGLVAKLERRPVRRLLQSLERTLDVQFEVSRGRLVVQPGPETTGGLRARARDTLNWLLQDAEYSRQSVASEGWLVLADLQASFGDQVAARKALETLILDWPQSTSADVARLRLGRMLWNGPELGQALAVLLPLVNDGVVVRDERSEAGLLTARAYMLHGRLDMARRSLDYVIRQSERRGIVDDWVNRAKAYRALLHVHAAQARGRAGEEEARREELERADAVVEDLHQGGFIVPENADPETRRVALQARTRALLGLGKNGDAAWWAVKWIEAYPDPQRQLVEAELEPTKKDAQGSDGDGHGAGHGDTPEGAGDGHGAGDDHGNDHGAKEPEREPQPTASGEGAEPQPERRLMRDLTLARALLARALEKHKPFQAWWYYKRSWDEIQVAVADPEILVAPGELWLGFMIDAAEHVAGFGRSDYFDGVKLAAEALEEAVTLAASRLLPETVDLRLALGRLYRAHGEHEKVPWVLAELVIEDSLVVPAPTAAQQAEAILELAQAERAGGNLDQALRLYQRLARGEQYPRALRQQALMAEFRHLDDLNRTGEAVRAGLGFPTAPAPTAADPKSK